MNAIPYILTSLGPVTPPPDHPTFLKPQIPLYSFPQTQSTTVADPPLPSPDLDPQPAMSQTTGTPAKPNTADTTLDPKALAMVSRIKNFYQQRCLAITTLQQQRCQAFANTQQQKAKEATQAAMLVVAWYVRDRIQRRRRRQKTKFRSALRQRCAVQKVTRGEACARWVMHVPDTPLLFSPDAMDVGRVEENAMPPKTEDITSSEDKDAKLFEVADSLIRRQRGSIQIPLLGVVNFDESDSETEEASSEGEDEDEDEDELEEDIGDEEYDEDDDDDDDLYDDDDIPDGHVDADMDSELVHNGTGHGGTRHGGSGSRGVVESSSS